MCTLVTFWYRKGLEKFIELMFRLEEKYGVPDIGDIYDAAIESKGCSGSFNSCSDT